MKPLSPRITIVLIILLCFLTRVPQLISPYLQVDGDEGVIGIMAKYLMQGKDFSLFFWGQNYGFSIVETGFIVPLYLVLGMNTIALKLAMLTLWTIGVVFFYKAMVQVNTGKKQVPLLLTLLLIAAPAWAEWSMKARGGYLTAFTLNNIALYLLFHKKNGSDKKNYLWLGIIAAIIYQSQLFWLVGLLPLVIYRLIKERSLAKAACFVLPFAVLTAGFYYYRSTIPELYSPGQFIPEKEMIGPLVKRIPAYCYNSLHGNYYFGDYQSPNLFCALFSAVFCILIVVMILVCLYHLMFRRKGYGLMIASGSAFVLCAAYTLFTRDMEGRYLLPLTGFALVTLQLYLDHRKALKAFSIGSVAMVVTGVVAVATFWGFQTVPATRAQLKELIAYLQQNQVRYVFATRGMIAWQVNFYSNEKVLCATTRRPAYQREIEHAFKSGEKTAVIGYAGETGELNLETVQPNPGFFVSYNVPKEKVRKLFIFHD